MRLSRPKYISIVICHYSQRDEWTKAIAARKVYLRRCLRSIEKTLDYPAELIVVDNGGRDDDSDFLLRKTRGGLINTYVRNKNNMFYGWAWNQGVKLATSNFVVLSVNDVIFKKGWAKKSLDALLNSKPKTLVAITGGKKKYNNGVVGDFVYNSWAGSDCMLMTKESFYDIGEYQTHHLAGSIWFNSLHAKGYRILTSLEPLATNSSPSRTNFSRYRRIEVKEDLLFSGTADFTDFYKFRGAIR